MVAKTSSNLLFEIPGPIQQRMRQLEVRDTRDREDGTPRLERLRQIPPESGILLTLLAANAPLGELLEIGTSGGYSALWLSLAARERGEVLNTYEILPEKIQLAEETFKEADVNEWVRLIQGDARSMISKEMKIAFCFLDAEKETYTEFFELIVPKLVEGGMLVADNVLSHAQELAGFIDAARSDARVDTVVLPVGKGLLICRKME